MMELRYRKRYYRDMTPLAAKTIRQLYFEGKLKQREIAWLFGIAQGSVSRIVSSQVWNQNDY